MTASRTSAAQRAAVAAIHRYASDRDWPEIVNPWQLERTSSTCNTWMVETAHHVWVVSYDEQRDSATVLSAAPIAALPERDEARALHMYRVSEEAWPDYAREAQYAEQEAREIGEQEARDALDDEALDDEA